MSLVRFDVTVDAARFLDSPQVFGGSLFELSARGGEGLFDARDGDLAQLLGIAFDESLNGVSFRRFAD